VGDGGGVMLLGIMLIKHVHSMSARSLPCLVTKRSRVRSFVDATSDTFGQDPLVNNDELRELAAKRVKTMTEIDKENDVSMGPRVSSDVMDSNMVDRGNEAEIRQNLEGIDQWFIQEFGQYVDFI